MGITSNLNSYKNLYRRINNSNQNEIFDNDIGVQGKEKAIYKEKPVINVPYKQESRRMGVICIDRQKENIKSIPK